MKETIKFDEFASYAEAKLKERKNSSFELSEITDIVQEDLNRRLVGADSHLRDNYDYWKAHCDNKDLYNQTSKEEVSNQITNLFEKIKNLKDDSENILYENHLTAIGFLENDLIDKSNSAVSQNIPEMVLQVINFFDQIEKIKTSDKKEHFLQQFPMKEEDDYNCLGGFSARLNPVLMILNSSNEAVASAHSSAVLASPLNKGDEVHNASLIAAINNINLGDEYYHLPIQQKSAQDLWKASIDYIIKIQEQFSNNQAIVKKDLIDLATIFDERKKEVFEEKLNKKSGSQELESLKKYQAALQKYALKETDFNVYDEDYMPVSPYIDDTGVQAELDNRIQQYYPLGIKEHPILSNKIKNIESYRSNITRKFIFDILSDNYKESSIEESQEEIIGAEESKGETPEETNYKIGSSVEEILVNDYPLKLLALNYLWIGFKKNTNPLEPIFFSSEEIVLGFLEKNEQEQKDTIQEYCSKLHDVLSASFDEKQNMSAIKISNIEEEIKNYITNYSHKNNQDLLFVSAKKGHLEAVNQILRKKLVQDLNQANQHGDTALICAIKEGHEEIVSLLLERGANPNQADKNGDKPLVWALPKGNKGIFESLLKRGANPNEAYKNGNAVLTWALLMGHKGIVELLLDNGANPNQADKNGTTALIWAVKNDHEGMVNLLLERGANPNQASQNGDKPLIWALPKGNKGIFESLLKRGANPNEAYKNGNAVLTWALLMGHKGIVELLLDNGANPNQADKNGTTALIWAVKNDHEGMVNLLLEKGANPNKSDKNENIALISAAKNGHEEIVKSLLEKGTDPNQADKNENIALILAAKNGHEGIVKWLLEKGANPNQANEDGETTLATALIKGHEGIFNLLLEKGADPNQVDAGGKVALELATFGLYKVKLAREVALLGKGANLNQAEKLLEVHEGMVKSLLKYGADFRNDVEDINKLGLSDLLEQCQNIENCAQQINVKIAETNNFSQNAINNLNPLIYRSLCKNVFISSDPQSINNSIELINSNQDLIAENLSSNIEILRESKSTSTNDNIEVKNNFDHLNQDNVSIINEVIGKFFNAQNTQTNKSENTTSEESGSVKVTSFGKLNSNERSREE